MPLEQIRPTLALDPDQPRRFSSLLHYNDDSPAQSPSEASERNEWLDDGTIRRSSSLKKKEEEMSLAKLGGVGGVTRSGSWGRNAAVEGRDHGKEGERHPHGGSKLVKSPYPLSEEDQDDDAQHRNPCEGTIFSGRRIGGGGISQYGCGSSGIPSSSSRTSTSSSSAAAFSLRSLFNRNSTGSVSSTSSSSIGSRPTSEGHSTHSHEASGSGTASIQDQPDSASEATTLAETRNDFNSTSDITSTEGRIHSAGGSSTPDASQGAIAPSSFSLHTTSSGYTGDVGRPDSLVRNSPSGASPVPSPKDKERSAKDVVSLDSAHSKFKQPSSDYSRSSDAAIRSTQLNKSSKESVVGTSRLQSGLTDTMWPPTTRRHSGMFMLRSRSQLALHAGLQMSFANGSGRAAARNRVRHPAGLDNAPFSVLEARRLAHHDITVSQPTSPALHATSEFVGRNRGPVLTVRTQNAVDEQPDTLHLSDPLAGGAEPEFSQLSRTESDSAAETGQRRALPVLAGTTGLFAEALSAPPFQANKSELAIDASSKGRVHLPTTSSSSTRPGMSRSPSIQGPNVLRTPTTEEWSRFLESQGVSLSSGRHSRAGTNFSAVSTGQLGGSRLGMSALSSSSRNEMDSDDDLDSDDSDENLAAGVLEKLKQLGYSRAASRAGSVIGEDLESLHEEEEDDGTGSPSTPAVPRSNSATLMPALVAIPRMGGRAFSPSASPSMSPRTPSSPGAGPCSVDATPQPTPERTQTIRSPRSKRPSKEALGVTCLYPSEHHAERKIDDFVIISDIGRGAYGLVKKARMMGVDGKPIGDEVIIKYIIKSRILADCWRRHRVLGPIPIEIHVMDQLRRLPYTPPPLPASWSPGRAQGTDDYRSKLQVEAVDYAGPPTASRGPSHPNICKMLDFFEDHEFYYMVMPCFGTGQDLFDYVESAPNGLDTFQVRSIFGQVADALRFLHANNIVHRDVKDENVILDGHGNAQLIDFGSAAHVRSGRLFDTFSGTLDYAAAEILRGEKYAGQAQDVWALGVMGYVLLCGECPFWNGEEAIEGLAEGSRAAHTLKERCLIATADGEQVRDGGNAAQQAAGEASMDPAWSPAKKRAGQEADGGGGLEDAADLITRCLEVDSEARPTTEQICQHRFLTGQYGWTGPRGWSKTRAQEASSASGPIPPATLQFPHTFP